MSSSTSIFVMSLLDADRQRVLTQQRVFGAAAALVGEAPQAHDGPTVSELAARAQITQAALHAHFPSIDVVFADLYLDRFQRLPLIVDSSVPASKRVSEQFRKIAAMFDDEPRLVSVCTRALMADDDAVAEARARIAGELHRRVTSTLGAGAWSEVVATLETVFWGVLLQMKSRPVSRHALAAQLDTMISVILAED